VDDDNDDDKDGELGEVQGQVADERHRDEGLPDDPLLLDRFNHPDARDPEVPLVDIRVIVPLVM